MPGWSRETSAFQPVHTKSGITPVIQREVLDQTLSKRAHDDNLEKNNSQTVLETANMETVPDNVEQPLDADVSSIKKVILSIRDLVRLVVG